MREWAIADLANHTAGYTLPWGFMLNEHGDLYVRGDYPVETRQAGTMRWPIGRGDDGRLYTSTTPSQVGLPTDVQHAVRCWRAERVYPVDTLPAGRLVFDAARPALHG